jgi:hypothetical protein
VMQGAMLHHYSAMLSCVVSMQQSRIVLYLRNTQPMLDSVVFLQHNRIPE